MRRIMAKMGPENNKSTLSCAYVRQARRHEALLIERFVHQKIRPLVLFAGNVRIPHHSPNLLLQLPHAHEQRSELCVFYLKQSVKLVHDQIGIKKKLNLCFFSLLVIEFWVLSSDVFKCLNDRCVLSDIIRRLPYPFPKLCNFFHFRLVIEFWVLSSLNHDPDRRRPRIASGSTIGMDYNFHNLQMNGLIIQSF